MAFTYAAFVDTETDSTALAYPLTDNNMLPALVLWAVVTLNVRNRYPNNFGAVTAGDVTLLAQSLGVTENTVQRFLDLGKQNAFRATLYAASQIFEGEIANPPNLPPYGNVGCPTTVNPIAALAKAGAVVTDPGKNTTAVPRPHKKATAADLANKPPYGNVGCPATADPANADESDPEKNTPAVPGPHENAGPATK